MTPRPIPAISTGANSFTCRSSATTAAATIRSRSSRIRIQYTVNQISAETNVASRAKVDSVADWVIANGQQA